MNEASFQSAICLSLVSSVETVKLQVVKAQASLTLGSKIRSSATADAVPRDSKHGKNIEN
jgi:hypothetical protein